MEEYFDVLDEFGNKTGKTKLRSEVHKDGDFHKSVHIWILNEKGDILLQRRSCDKDSFPNMLDLSSAGHLQAGDDSLSGAIREIKEELNIDVNENDLTFIQTIKECDVYNQTFIDNEYIDIYFLRTTLAISDMEYQEEEISEIMFVPYKKYKEMIKNKQKDLVIYGKELDLLFSIFDKEFDN